jgi:hypothetical protein
MAQVKFSNGKTVTFNGTPTPEDIDFVAKQLGILPSQPTQNKPGYGERLVGDYQQALKEIPSGINEATNKLQQGDIIGGVRTAMLRPAATAARAVFAPVTEAIAPLFDKAVGSISDNKTVQRLASSQGISSFLDTISQWQQQNPDKAKDVKDMFDIIASIAGGKGVARGAKVVSNVATKGGEILSSTSEATKGATAKAISLTGGIMEKTGKKLMSGALPPTPLQAGQILNYRAATPILERIKQASLGTEKPPVSLSEVAMKYNLSGLTLPNIGSKTRALTDAMWKDTVNPALDKIKTIVPKQDIFKTIQTEINNMTEMTTKNQIQKAFNAFKEDYKNVDSWGVKELDKLKSELAGKLPKRVWLGEDITGELATVRQLFSDNARKIVREQLPEAVKTIYDEYGSLREIYNRAKKALTIGTTRGVLGMTSWALQSILTPALTIGGNVIGKTGQLLRKSGNKLLK